MLIIIADLEIFVCKNTDTSIVRQCDNLLLVPLFAYHASAITVRKDKVAAINHEQ